MHEHSLPENDTVIVVPNPGERFVIPTVDTPEVQLFNNDGTIVTVSPETEQADSFSITTHDLETDDEFVDSTGLTLQSALTDAADMQGFDLYAGGEPVSVIDEIDGQPTFDTFSLDPDRRGGLVVSGPKHFPLQTTSDDRGEYRIRVNGYIPGPDDENQRSWVNEYFHEYRHSAECSWDLLSHHDEPIALPLAFFGYFDPEWNAWNSRFDLDLGQYIAEVDMRNGIIPEGRSPLPPYERLG